VPDTPGPGGIGAIAIVLDPLGLPVGVAVILLSVVDPLVEPAVTVADVHGNCMAAALVVEAASPGAGTGLASGPETPASSPAVSAGGPGPQTGGEPRGVPA
jgi:hypothetical protein